MANVNPLGLTPTPFLQQQSPAPYDAQIVQAANANGLDPALLRGIIQIESKFNPNAVSSTFATGLGQTLVSTGLDPNRLTTPLGATAADVQRNALDPRQSIDFTAQYLHSLVVEYGSTDAAVNHYSGGGYNAGRAIAANNQLPPINSDGNTPAQGPGQGPGDNSIPSPATTAVDPATGVAMPASNSAAPATSSPSLFTRLTNPVSTVTASIAAFFTRFAVAGLAIVIIAIAIFAMLRPQVNQVAASVAKHGAKILPEIA